ncbi:MAG: hypothetical protein K6C38_09720 [Saccharofermentans sp.]|nr:hypothetical protein [Saccharofermentans sp.]
MVISLTKERMEELFLQYLQEIFEHPEIRSCCVKGIVISRETLEDAGKKAFESSFHDLYSDVDLSVKVRLPKDGSVTPEEYTKRIDRFGVNEDTALGWMFVPENSVCRIVFYNGMRYDLIFEFEYADDVSLYLEDLASPVEDNKDWPVDNINRFWFIQIQALGKLYRRDHLISAHLANANCNDTLVMQMILRDQQYGTNHHRYGYSEDLEYVKDLGKCPYKSDDPVCGRIADHIYAAALAYDRLVKIFYPKYQDRSDAFFDIWNWYDVV